MNELELQQAYVTGHPEDRIAARALVDMTEERLEVPHRSALRSVAALRKANRDAKEMAEAAKLLKPDSGIRHELRVAVIVATEVSDSDPVNIVVRPGGRPPVAYSCDWHGRRAHWAYWSITVGARWVIAKAAELWEERDDARREKYRDIDPFDTL